MIGDLLEVVNVEVDSGWTGEVWERMGEIQWLRREERRGVKTLGFTQLGLHRRIEQFHEHY